MTVKEFYEWAKENNWENFDVLIQYRDEGGDYDGSEELDLSWRGEVDGENKTITI